MGGLRCWGVGDMNQTLIVAVHFCLLAPSQPVAMGSRMRPRGMAAFDWSAPSCGPWRGCDVINSRWCLGSRNSIPFRVMVSLSLEAAQTDRQVSIFDCRSHFVARSGFIFAARLPFWIFLACRGFGNAALALRNPSLLAIHTCASLPGFIRIPMD
jgi:hypothetical protein